MIDPLHQFTVKEIVPMHIFGMSVSITNSSLFMILSVAVVCFLGLMATRKPTIIPGRLQFIFESLFHFIHEMLQNFVGPKGVKYFPYILTLFLFIYTGNMLGMVPGGFTFTSQLILTFAMAALVFISVTIIGFIQHGVKFLKIFMPDGIPLYVAPLLIPVEIISYFSRPVSLSVRLFANMVAGHVMLKIFASFAVMIAGSAFLPGVILPIFMNIAITAFEFLVAILQAYVFAILTCIYLNDAINLH